MLYHLVDERKAFYSKTTEQQYKAVFESSGCVFEKKY
jgi:hypothetical protein